MKGVKNKLSFTLGKKPREAKKNTTDIKLQPLTGPSKSRIYTGPNGRSDAPSTRKDTSIPRPNGSKFIGSKTPKPIIQEDAAYPPEIPEERTLKTLQTDDSKINRDVVEDKIVKESKYAKRPQGQPPSRIDFDRLVDNGKRARDEVKDNVDILIDKYAPGFPKGQEGSKPSSQNENDVRETHETGRVETPLRIKEECDDDLAAGKSYCVFVDKQDDFPTEQHTKITKEPDSPATQSNDSLEIDPDAPLIKQAIRMLHPKHDPVPPAVPQLTEAGSPEEDRFTRPTPNQTPPRYDYTPAYPSGEQPEEEKREAPGEFPKDIYGLDAYNGGVYFNYGLNDETSSNGEEHGPSTSPFNKQPEGNNYAFNPEFNPNHRHNDQPMRKYPYELPSDRYTKMETMDILEEYEDDPDRDNFYQRGGFLNPDSKDEGMGYFPGPDISKHFKAPATNLDTNTDSRPDAYPFKDDAESLPTKPNTQIANGHKTDYLKIINDAGYMTLSFDEVSGQRLSLFGRWMVTHGQLVDPDTFCIWSHASCPDQYIDLSKYQMDMQGRWMDTNGLYITPFFFCYSYDGEPVYLGDCDCYDVFNNSFDIGADDSKDFANNPERYIDLSNFQMDMDERWMDSCGRYTELTDWYNIEAEEEEYPEYGWLYNRCKSPDLFYMPEGMDEYGQDFSQEENSYLQKTDDLVTSNPYPMDFPFSEDYAFWEYPERHEGSTEDPTSLPNSWMGTGDFCNNFHGNNEDVFNDEDETDSYPYRQYLATDKTK